MFCKIKNDFSKNPHLKIWEDFDIMHLEYI